MKSSTNVYLYVTVKSVIDKCIKVMPVTWLIAQQRYKTLFDAKATSKAMQM